MVAFGSKTNDDERGIMISQMNSKSRLRNSIFFYILSEKRQPVRQS